MTSTTQDTAKLMSKLLFPIMAMLFLAGSAEAKTSARPAQSTSGDCAELRLTAFTGIDNQAPVCCAQSTHCPRFLAITPMPRNHRELRT